MELSVYVPRTDRKTLGLIGGEPPIICSTVDLLQPLRPSRATREAERLWRGPKASDL